MGINGFSLKPISNLLEFIVSSLPLRSLLLASCHLFFLQPSSSSRLQLVPEPLVRHFEFFDPSSSMWQSWRSLFRLCPWVPGWGTLSLVWACAWGVTRACGGRQRSGGAWRCPTGRAGIGRRSGQMLPSRRSSWLSSKTAASADHWGPHMIVVCGQSFASSMHLMVVHIFGR